MGVWYNKNMENVLFSWEIDEYRVHQRGKWWYLLFFGLVGIISLYAITAANFLFLFIVLMIAGITLLSANRSPRQLVVSIEQEGLRIGGEWHPWKNIKYFWVVNEPEVQSLYLETAETFKPHLCVSLAGQNATKITNLVKKFVSEESHEEPLTDILTRVFKL